MRLGMQEDTQHVLVRQWAGSKRKHDACSSDGTRQLRDAVKNESHRANTASEEEGEADVGIEEPARGAEEEPGGDEQAESERRRDVERLLEDRPLYVVRGLHPTKRQEQKHGRADKLEGGRLQVVSQARLWPESSNVRRSCSCLCRHRREEIKVTHRRGRYKPCSKPSSLRHSLRHCRCAR